ncbi:MAG: DNA primase [Candidatus Gribaldobacteria bacterium]|nr:DNA primase [Candidatus Gribaldobacteria bacterium]
MDNTSIQQIKERLDIVEVVSGYLKLEKTGINLRARCPFHTEKGPSFFVSPARQMFKCFGCGVAGSVFDFVMKMEGLEFGDTLRMLAKRAGVELKAVDPVQSSKRQNLSEICEQSCRFFEKYLTDSQAGKLVQEYLKNRGLLDETVKKWRLGYAPDTWRALVDFLISRGYKKEEIVETGVAIASEKTQSAYDRFRNRVMFPIFDLNSQVIGFGGRVFDKIPTKTQGQSEGGAKYVNISNTQLYDKSRVLYGLNFAKLAIRQKDACIITEGYMDVILSHQGGFENTVAASGTALTPYQLQIIKRYTNNLLTAFDMDPAGGMATTRGIDLAQREDFNVKVITMTPEADPADIISKDPSQWAKEVETAKDIIDFYFNLAQTRFNRADPQGKKEIAKMLLPVIKRVANKIVQSHWAQKLANLLGASEESVLAELHKLPQEAPVYQNESLVANNKITSFKVCVKSRREMLEDRIMCLLALSPGNLSMVGKDRLNIFSPTTQEFLEIFWQNNFDSKDKFQEFIQKSAEQFKLPECVQDFLSFHQEEELDPADRLFEAKKAKREKDAIEELGECLKQLHDLNKKNQVNNLAQEIHLAEQQGDAQKLKELLEIFHQRACF